MPVVVTDTTVLNNFAQIGRPDLLRWAFPGLAAPQAVREELAKGERLGHVPAGEWSWLDLCELTVAEQSRAADFERHLQAGEAACLAVAEARGGLVLTDDRAARLAAVALKLEVSGTLGALINLVRQEILTLEEGDALLIEMMVRGYRSPVRSLSEVNPGG
jgi:predicted nucleic acid-binding protein